MYRSQVQLLDGAQNQADSAFAATNSACYGCCCCSACLQPVDLKVFILNFEFQKYCNAELRSGNYTPTATAPNGWYQFSFSLADFKCDYDGALPSQVNRIEFQNTAELPALFCLAGLRLLR
jgi:hypothetical protein